MVSKNLHSSIDDLHPLHVILLIFVGKSFVVVLAGLLADFRVII